MHQDRYHIAFLGHCIVVVVLLWSDARCHIVDVLPKLRVRIPHVIFPFLVRFRHLDRIEISRENNMLTLVFSRQMIHRINKKSYKCQLWNNYS